MMKKLFFHDLSFQIIMAISLGLTAMAVGQYFFTERILEESILNSTKKQAYTFLLGIEREIHSVSDPYDTRILKKIFNAANRHDTANLDFSIHNIYLYNKKGQIIASLNEQTSNLRDMSGHYGSVIRGNTPYYGKKERTKSPGTPQWKAFSTDVIIPVHYRGEIIGGLEVEINLNKTMEIIKNTDDQYEKKIILLLVITIVLLLIFLWSIMRWRLIKPVTDLNHVTQKISRGDFSARVRVNSRDEIGQLGQAINHMAYSIEGLFDQLDQTYIGTLNSLSKALETRDDYTANHSENVTSYSLLLGHRLGLSPEDITILAQGAMLHDLGKIGIPDNILFKPGPLDDSEYTIIKNHTELTSDILKPLESFKRFSEIARSHHERWDGKGYPDGLAGKQIPLLARIVSIADTWDSMTSDRVYRKGMTKEKALAILEKEKDNGQWDPTLLEQFISLVKKDKVIA